MAIGTASNFKIYDEFTQSGWVETMTQMSDAFNAASAGAIVLTAETRKGDVDYESFFKDTANLVTRRINTGSGSTSDVTDKSLDQGELAGIKLNRKIGPVAQTLDAFKKIQKGPFDKDALNFAVGVQSAKGAQVEQLNTALRAVRAALAAQASVSYTVPTNGTLATANLVSGLALFGDAASQVKIWVMHSKPYYDLVQQQIAANITGISSMNIASASPVTLNRPVLVTDSPALAVASGSPAVTDYYTLGLTDGAVTLDDSEEETIVTEIITGKENLLVRFQGEYAYNISMKGFSWDVANGGKNPSDTAIGTAGNWDPQFASFKDWAGIVIKSR